MAIELAALELAIQQNGADAAITKLRSLDAAGRAAAGGMGHAGKASDDLGDQVDKVGEKAQTTVFGLGRVERAIAAIAIAETGANPHLAHLAVALSQFAIEGFVVVGVLAGIAAVSTVMKLLGKDSTDAAANIDKAYESMQHLVALRNAAEHGAVGTARGSRAQAVKTAQTAGLHFLDLFGVTSDFVLSQLYPGEYGGQLTGSQAAAPYLQARRSEAAGEVYKSLGVEAGVNAFEKHDEMSVADIQERVKRINDETRAMKYQESIGYPDRFEGAQYYPSAAQRAKDDRAVLQKTFLNRQGMAGFMGLPAIAGDMGAPEAKDLIQTVTRTGEVLKNQAPVWDAQQQKMLNVNQVMAASITGNERYKDALDEVTKNAIAATQAEKDRAEAQRMIIEDLRSAVQAVGSTVKELMLDLMFGQKVNAKGILRSVVGAGIGVAEHAGVRALIRAIPFLAGLAEGGDVGAGGVALVGEAGPELLTVGTSGARVTPIFGGGSVLPSASIGGAVSSNMGARVPGSAGQMPTPLPSVGPFYVFGERDPVAQRMITSAVANAMRRGYALT